jgi:adenine-specific DNA-methyltransferase
MSKKKQKLELTWIGKENRPKLEPRILIEDPEKSYHAPHRVSENDQFDNKLIFGDNLLALKALEQEYVGKVKCIFIDPPYNTGSAFQHYDDGVEHSIWLGLMRDRLEILCRLLSDDGSLWITIDDNECHYLKVLCDEIFGRSNFLASVVWNHSVQGKGYSGKFSVHHNYVLVYRKAEAFMLADFSRLPEHNINYSNPDNDPKGAWRSGDVRNSLVRPNLVYDIETPNGNIIKHPPKGWRFSRDTFEKELSEGKIKFSDDETRIIRKIYLADQGGRVPETVWFSTEAGTTREATSEIRAFVEADFFDTPKPERLLRRILELSTNPGDLVLDSFLGSGTTAAVAHKMGRRWIGIELGEHCHTHCIPRLKKVIDGEDGGGITKAVNWQGGGGFRYYKLGPTLIVEDEWGNPVINKEFDAAMLAEAMCKLEGFTFNPDSETYWQHGQSTETDFIYVTTQFMSKEMLTKISEEVGENQSLLICCSAFRCDVSEFKNLTVKKIPKAVLKKCEWGHDDYSLEVENLPEAPPEYLAAQAQETKATKKKPARKFGKDKNQNQASLFDMADEAQGGK